MSGRRKLREHVKSNPFSLHIRKIAKALEADDDEYITYIETFLKSFPPSTSRGSIEENGELIKRLNLLDLVLDKILPATFADAFLSMLHMLVQIDDFDIEIYSSDGLSKIIYSMKENMENDIQIIGSKIISYLALNEALRDAMGDESEVIEHLIDAMDQLGKSSEQVCRHILHALINITYDNEQNKFLVCKFGSQILVETALNYIDNEEYTVLNDFMILFRNMVNCDDGRYALSQLNLINIILHIFNNITLSNETIHLYSNTFWTLINYNCGNNNNMLSSIDLGIIPILLSFLSVDIDNQFSSLASLALYQLSRLSKARNEIIENNGVIKVIELIKSLENEESLEYPCKLLERLCINEKAKQIIIENEESSKNILSLLTKMNRFDDVSFHHSIVKFLYRFIQDRDENISFPVIKILKENQGISVLVTSMNSHHQASQLKARICDILNSLFSNDKNSDETNTDTSSDECSEGSDRMNEDYDSNDESRIDNDIINESKTNNTQYESFHELDNLENYYNKYETKSNESEENFNLNDIENIDIECMSNENNEENREINNNTESDDIKPQEEEEDTEEIQDNNQINNESVEVEETSPDVPGDQIEESISEPSVDRTLDTNKSYVEAKDEPGVETESVKDIREQNDPTVDTYDERNNESHSDNAREKDFTNNNEIRDDEDKKQLIQSDNEEKNLTPNDIQPTQTNINGFSPVKEENVNSDNNRPTKVKDLVQKWALVTNKNENNELKNPKLGLDEEIEQKRVKNAFSFWLEKDKTSRTIK